MHPLETLPGWGNAKGRQLVKLQKLVSETLLEVTRGRI